jgi:acetyltransferase-like isoleucine patch superfamily enzyme
MKTVHQTAVLETSQIGENISVGAYAVVDKQVKLGNNVKIHSHVVISGAVEIGDDVEILPFAYIGRLPSSSASIKNQNKSIAKTKIGSETVISPHAILYAGCNIGAQCLVGDAASIRENVNISNKAIVGRHVTIGPNVEIGARTRIVDFAHITGDTVIGEDVFISTHVCSANDNSFATGQDIKLKGQNIGNRVHIGLGAVLLPGITIGDDSVIGAGSIVTKDIPTGKLAFGQPAKLIRDLKSKEQS